MPSARGMHRCVAAEILVNGVVACTLQVPHRLLMCPKHWGMVKQDTQRQLWRAYRRAPAGDGHAIQTDAYLTAVACCVEDVREKLGGTLKEVAL